MQARERIQQALAGGVAAGLPGLVAAARLPGGEVVQASAGVRTLGQPATMTPDTVFWIASFTKAVTTAAVLRLVEAGQVGLDDPASRWLPVLATSPVLTGFDADGAPVVTAPGAPVTIRQLLAHTSGLAYPFCNDALTRLGASEALGQRHEAPLMFEPGADWTYGVGLDWAGELVAAVTGRTLDAYLAEEVFAPLGMTETSFNPRLEQLERLAGMHGRMGDTLAPMPFQLPPPPNPSMGGGGLYSTASDYLKFLDAILAGGGPILSSASTAAMARPEAEGLHVGVLPGVNLSLCAGYDPFPGRVKQFGLGFVINPEPVAGGRSAGSLAWAGLGNCYYWADPATGVAGVFLAQLLPFGDAAALEAFGAFERAVYSG